MHDVATRAGVDTLEERGRHEERVVFLSVLDNAAPIL